MMYSDIISIAVKCGWRVSMNYCRDNRVLFDFQRRTSNGVSFCFTATMSGCKVTTLIDDIISLVDALNPERFASDWMENIGDTSHTRYLKAVDDMDEMRTRVWLLAVELSTAAENEIFLLDLPWYRLN